MSNIFYGWLGMCIEGNNYKESIMNEPITKGSFEDEHLYSINAL